MGSKKKEKAPKVKGDLRAAQSEMVLQAQAMETALQAANTTALVETQRAQLAVQNTVKTAQSAENMLAAAKRNTSRTHVGGKDMVGMLGGTLSNEGINWLMRRLADWSPAFAQNVDLWQSLPQLVVGMVVYWSELLTRKKDANGAKMFPSMPREIASEWAKVFQILGANNLWRALRVRSGDTKKTMADLKAAQLELDALKAELAAAKKG